MSKMIGAVLIAAGASIAVGIPVLPLLKGSNNKVFPPGTILQRLYLKERLKKITPGFFIEVGCGHGDTSKILLENGWSGIAYELNRETAAKALENNQTFVSKNQFKVIVGNFINQNFDGTADLVISNMVIEHLSDEDEKKYFMKCKEATKSNGKVIFSVPAGMKYWGIEDKIAGHYRRYERDEIEKKLSSFGYKLQDLKGLTYPLSNTLYSLSNVLIQKQEAYKLKMSMENQTELSGNRSVKYKTNFPKWMIYFLNEYTMYPFHIIQKCFSNHKNTLILYAEASKIKD